MQKKKKKTRKSKDLDWYSAKGLFKHAWGNKDAKDRYEEAVFVLKAISEDEAAEHAIKLFNEYANEYADDEMGINFTGHYDICPLHDPVRAGRQAYWFMRISRLSPRKYVEKYWNDGKPDSCDERGWTHVWYNNGNNTSGCYNCYEVRKGQLWKKD